MPGYFALTEAIASHCCNAIRLKRVVKVEVATKRLVFEEEEIRK